VDGNLSSKLDKDVCSSVNPRAILGMLCTMGSVTVFVNDVFNRFDIMTKEFKDSTDNHASFYADLKKIVTAYRPQYDQFSFIGKKEKISGSLHKEFPLLKNYELSILVESMSDEELKLFNQTLGIENPKKKKLTKKEMPKKNRHKQTEPDVWSFKEWRKRMLGENE
jgi:hypothetical protein